MKRLKTLYPLILIFVVTISCGLADKAEQVTQLARSVEEAQKSLSEGDTSGAFGALFGGGAAVEPVDFRKLTPLLPASLRGHERTNAGGEKNRVMGMGTSKAEGEYVSENGQSRITVSINDLGSVRGLGMLGFNWLMVEVDKATDQGYERTFKHDGRPAYIKYEQGGDWSRGEISVFVADRFVVNVNGSGVTEGDLRDALGQVSLRRLDAMKDEGVGEGGADLSGMNEFIAQHSDNASSDTEQDAVDETIADAGSMEGASVEPIDFRELRQLLPESIHGLARTNTEGETGGALGVKTSSAVATYGKEDDPSANLTVKIFDSGTLGGAMMLGGYGWLALEVDRENDQGFERTTTFEGHRAYEKFSHSGSNSQSTMQALIAGRFVVEIQGRGLEMETVRSVMSQIDLDALEAMKSVGVTPAS